MNAWNTSPAPKDGTRIVAIGRVIGEDGICMVSDPFCAAVLWEKPQGGMEGWHYTHGLSVARYQGDEVVIDWWLPDPRGAQ